MATTTNFGWETPDDTDLVKDGAAAMRTLGNAIDTSLVDLKGGTTGQILSKASNTDLDYTWINNDQGDITGVTAGTGLTGGGTSGAVTLDFDVANYGGGQYAAGKNKIINGNFSIWQRGTSFSNPASAAYTADRWSVVWDGSGATRTISQQTFTAGNAITGYEPGNFFRFNQSVAGTGGTYNLFQNRMEDVRTFAGQTVTISFWAKAAANTNLVKLNLEQEFGTGGSPSATVSTDLSTGTITITTSWQRFSYTTTVPSISGKTVGTTTPGYLGLRIWLPVNSTFTFDIWGVQVEAGSTATPFQTATGTIQGELAACQRYYESWTAGGANYGLPGAVIWTSATTGKIQVNFAVPKRVAPSVTFANVYTTSGGAAVTPTAMSFFGNSTSSGVIGGNTNITSASGGTNGYAGYILDSGGGTGYINWSAEL